MASLFKHTIHFPFLSVEDVLCGTSVLDQKTSFACFLCRGVAKVILAASNPLLYPFSHLE